MNALIQLNLLLFAFLICRSVDGFQFLGRLNRFMDDDLNSEIDQDELVARLLQLAQAPVFASSWNLAPFVTRDKVRLY